MWALNSSGKACYADRGSLEGVQQSEECHGWCCGQVKGTCQAGVTGCGTHDQGQYVLCTLQAPYEHTTCFHRPQEGQFGLREWEDEGFVPDLIPGIPPPAPLTMRRPTGMRVWQSPVSHWKLGIQHAPSVPSNQ